MDSCFAAVPFDMYICISVDPLRALPGNSLKKEMNAINNLSVELPQANALRETLGKYKSRFEDAIDEILT